MEQPNQHKAKGGNRKQPAPNDSLQPLDPPQGDIQPVSASDFTSPQRVSQLTSSQPVVMSQHSIKAQVHNSHQVPKNDKHQMMAPPIEPFASPEMPQFDAQPFESFANGLEGPQSFNANMPEIDEPMDNMQFQRNTTATFGQPMQDSYQNNFELPSGKMPPSMMTQQQSIVTVENIKTNGGFGQNPEQPAQSQPFDDTDLNFLAFELVDVIEKQITKPKNELEQKLLKAALNYKSILSQQNPDMSTTQEFLDKVRNLDSQYINMAKQNMVVDEQPRDKKDSSDDGAESANARFLPQEELTGQRPPSVGQKSDIDVKSAGHVPNSNEEFQFKAGKRQRETISQHNSTDKKRQRRSEFDDAKSGASYEKVKSVKNRNVLNDSQPRNTIMNRNVLRQRLRVKLADRGFHNAGNQRFAPVDTQQKTKDIDELEKVSAEIVRATMREILEEYFKQQRQRGHATTLRQEAQGSRGNEKHAGEEVTHTVRHGGRGNQAPSEEPLKLLLTDTPRRYYQLLGIEEQRLTVLRKKQAQQEAAQAAQRKEQLVVTPGPHCEDPANDDELLQVPEAQSADPECLLDPETGKKMSRRRLHQLLQQPGGLKKAQIDELLQRGLLKNQQKSKTGNDQTKEKEGQMAKQEEKLSATLSGFGVGFLRSLRRDGVLADDVKLAKQ